MNHLRDADIGEISRPRRRPRLFAPLVLLCLMLLAVIAPGALAAGDEGGMVSSNPAWTWMNPGQGGESLDRVSFIDANEGWAVGMFKGVMHTVDGGQTWSASRFGAPLGSLDVCFVDQSHGWIVGQGSDSYGMDRYVSFIWATDDGGDTWRQQLYLDEYEASVNGGLGSVWFGDPDNGWAAGRASKLFHTVDGGTTWVRVEDLPVDEDRRDEIDFVDMRWVDNQTGFVLGSLLSSQEQSVQVLLATTDGGQTWAARNLPEYDPQHANAVFHVFFLDATHGYAGGWGNHIYYTEDGGQTWADRPVKVEKYSSTRALHFDDINHGWAIGGAGMIMKTDDGGLTWTPAHGESSAKLSTISRLEADTLLATGEVGFGLRSTDNGDSWQPAPGSWSPGTWSIDFVNETEGWMVSAGGLGHSVDEGRTWIPVEVEAADGLSSVLFIDAQHGWVACGGGIVARTADGGTTWQAVDTGAGSDLRSLCFVDANTGWAVGEDGAIAKTSDGGITWTGQESGTEALLNSVFFLDAQTGWAAGATEDDTQEEPTSTGWVLATRDGGATWTAHRFSELEQSAITQIHFSDAQHGMALGVASKAAGGMRGLFVTDDGGVSWTYQPMFPFVTSEFTRMVFPSAEKGLLVGENGVMFSTQDGGESWILHLRATPSDSITDCSFVNETTGYMVTSMGAVLKTDVGGALEYQRKFGINGHPLENLEISIRNKDAWFHTFYLAGYAADGHLVFDGSEGILSAANVWVKAGEAESYNLSELMPDCKEPLAKLVIFTGEDLPLESIADVSLTYSWSDIDEAMLAGYGLTLEKLNAISQGYPDGSWRPYAQMTRAQFVKIAVAAFGIQKMTPSSPTFTDVPPGDPYYPYVEGAVNAGLIKGVGGGRFEPNATISREQAAAIIARYVAAAQGIDLPTHYTAEQIAALLAPFSDAVGISLSLRAEIAYAVEQGVLLGSGGKLGAAAQLVRIEGAALVARAMK